MALKDSTSAEKSNASVYHTTTVPKKPKRRDKSDLGPNFVAPDGGWGWVVCIAAGLSNLCMYPPLQQYGMIYRQRLVYLGFSAKEITTIANVMLSVASLVGIVNGAMFRRFSFRQVAITGSILIFSGILLTSWCATFWHYILCLSIIYGLGQGLNVSALSLAVNTYFKNRRRRATAFTWTITGLGPIIFPHFTSLILIYYGGQGTILIYAGISLNTFLCALTLQPVLWHSPKPQNVAEEEVNEATKSLSIPINANELEYECKYCQYMKHDRVSVAAPLYAIDDNELDTYSYEFTEPGTPLMSRANDGWFGSKSSLNSSIRLRNRIVRHLSLKAPIAEAERDGDEDDDAEKETFSLEKPNQVNIELAQHVNRTEEFRCTCAEEKAAVQKLTTDELQHEQEKLKAAEEAEELVREKMSFRQKVVKFFDLDLLKDFTFVSLVLGMTVMMFAEINFSILIPFILDQYGYNNKQISTALSMLGGMDISVRFLTPFVLENVKLSNQVLFAFGIIAISLGRLLITITDSYYVTLGLFVLIGFGRGFRTIFSSLIIPTYVPLKRLPAASGLQLVCNTLFSLSFGPLLGVITDATSYTMTIHFLNLLTSLALLMWLLEYLVRRMLGLKRKTTMED
ncbi:uncharacterized protein LOC128858383 isoform X1 [Anastrepha ludens]|uniref:uncharacterized protein LOC128858383 isoform X1 n=2 Tax=Anastrepha ludens TaxID=28586 RepID=UPI0023B0CB74|nr:uncharacterized protein LOC128858383 isoform X1 [Anastrepha ludens]XP_053950585.1 uncharacterized protein LOC128858383 isoform X1 [Anastrepha ludens]XP_053950586.1 uncharacterized protein LOC128858383 isoform X1 [Anastrepha ludens]XP_053950587.1 uncharacterized protein LOC128858383 isoform X1 [Anastrepha ludens]XP_053950588.1 uncharacterized protein LOC128858383 isoform X1 [Anastrepha ludens]XP_053950589.1 uncharacterized protein LOC128858383 isoform X1 [Anastrepha ludens]XP_053950591.1 un